MNNSSFKWTMKWQILWDSMCSTVLCFSSCLVYGQFLHTLPPEKFRSRDTPQHLADMIYSVKQVSRIPKVAFSIHDAHWAT